MSSTTDISSTSLLGFSKEDLEHYVTNAGEKPYRVKQILEWIYKQRIDTIEEMSNLPAGLRDKLTSEFHLNDLQHVETKGSKDTTRKFLFRLHDGRYVESVLIPANPALYGFLLLMGLVFFLVAVWRFRFE